VTKISRPLRTGLLLAAGAVVLTACAGEPTNQLGFPAGAAPEVEGISLFEAFLLYFVAPASILLGTAALVWLPGMLRGTGYRPGRAWSAPPLWFGGPSDPAAAVESAETGNLRRGGASGSW
jgi:hypothetical protein